MPREGEPAPKLLTPDLLVDVVTDLRRAFDRVTIDDLEEGMFFAKLDIERYS